MTDTEHLRINELARELEVKAKVLIYLLPCFGVTEKKTRTSSIPINVAQQIRAARALIHRAAALATAPAASPIHAAVGFPAAASPKSAYAPAASENLHDAPRSSGKEHKQPTYNELLARVKWLESEVCMSNGFDFPRRSQQKKKKRKKRKKKTERKLALKSKRLVVSGGLPSLGKRR
jgi:hypothetical protein